MTLPALRAHDFAAEGVREGTWKIGSPERSCPRKVKRRSVMSSATRAVYGRPLIRPRMPTCSAAASP